MTIPSSTPISAELDTLKAKKRGLYEEGELDITFIPPEDKVETILARS